MKTETVQPNISNFIKSLRDIGYSFEIAVADIIDNSISAAAKKIDIIIKPEPELSFELFDDGIGMDELELVEAMRLATKNPDDKREKTDLGRFGLGLKTASFSQCKLLTVISKKNGIISARQWDLDFISYKNEWELITPEEYNIEKFNQYHKIVDCKNGTLVVWENIDRYDKSLFSKKITELREHIALVFHRFLEARPGMQKLEISINNIVVEPFDPFNRSHPATQQIPDEIIFLHDEQIIIQPYILPHHSKIAQNDYEYYATKEGYIRSQGFYLYRENRLLIYGTWWGLHQATDAHKLVRIKIDITSDQDKYWGIDIKKSKAYPTSEIKSELKRIIKKITVKGSRPYSGRGRKITDKTTTRFWDLVPHEGKIRFMLNQEHPVLKQLYDELDAEQFLLLDKYLKCIQSYIPIEAIQAQLQERPHDIDQKGILNEDEALDLIKYLESVGSNYAELIKTEIFKNKVG
ncbi:ATP-binding protein [Vallitalea sediminicola]